MLNERAQRKAETRAAILAAARELFAERGYDATTTRAIAARAGVAAGTVFVHFPNKVDLVVAALEETIRGALTRAYAALPDRGLVDQLVTIARHLYAAYAEQPALSRVLVREVLFIRHDEPSGRPMGEQLAAFLLFVTGLIETARRRGEIDGDLDAGFGAHAFFAMYFAVLAGGLRGELDVAGQEAALSALLTRFFRRREP